jgi:S1-C subfamily serine protease
MSGRLVRGICFLSIFFFVFTLFAFGQNRSTETFILTIERVKHSVVPILCGRLDNKGQFSVQLIDGTGFFIDSDGHFLTASHVINDLKGVSSVRPIPCIPAIYVPDNGWQRDAPFLQAHWFTFPVDGCKIDTALDLAVCKTIQAPGGIRPIAIYEYRPPDGYPVAFTGFPLGSIEPLSSRCEIATYRNSIDQEGSRELVLDKGTWPGASGSPIYDERGVVLGIVLQRGINDGVGIAVGRPSHFILMFLRKNGIAVKGEPNNPNKHRKWLW